MYYPQAVDNAEWNPRHRFGVFDARYTKMVRWAWWPSSSIFAARCSGYGRRTPGCRACWNCVVRTRLPAPEQLSAPVAAPGLVTMASPVGDKLALFADRFRARADVYAVRWENTRTGAAGWMPAVAGGWRKGMDRRGAAYLPRTPEVVAAHLVGDVFMGLYPLLPGNTCQFVVADFDGADGDARRPRLRQGGTGQLRCRPRWRSPSRAAAPTCGSSSPARFPRRRRGQSAPHCCTRRWCCAGRWTCGRTTGCSPTRTSCPRAASATSSPHRLQGRRRKDGLTTFLDLGTLEPYEDQWAFLSTLDRLSPGDAERVARTGETCHHRHRRRHDEPVRRDPGPSTRYLRWSTRKPAPG